MVLERIEIERRRFAEAVQRIAGDGAYNRTLTPIGFQSERRDLWEAPNVYLSMSPFLYANNLTGALLMYHGLADQNVGTDPTNSIRLHHAASAVS